MELADMQDLGSCAARRMGSSPIFRSLSYLILWDFWVCILQSNQRSNQKKQKTSLILIIVFEEHTVEGGVFFHDSKDDQSDVRIVFAIIRGQYDFLGSMLVRVIADRLNKLCRDSRNLSKRFCDRYTAGWFCTE